MQYNTPMLLAKNKKALFKHEVLDKYMAGIVLKGYEVKAIKENKASFEGSYIQFLGGELYVTNMHIGKYSKQSQEFDTTAAVRPRKLLLNQKEIGKIAGELHQKGKTAVPLALLLKHNLIKLEFAVVKGRKKHDKKVVAKEKQIKKELEKKAKSLQKYSY